MDNKHPCIRVGLSGLGTGEFTEKSFRVVFGLDKEYRHVIRSVYTDMLDAVGKGGGKVMERMCEESSFLVRYKTAINGRPTTGTIRGWVGLVNAKSTSSVISVDVREETEGQ